jgi:YesN/AraC family two-component response regulator
VDDRHLGREALALMPATPPDVLLSDVGMPTVEASS